MNHAFAACRSRTKVAQTSKSAVSRISKSAGCPNLPVLPTWKSATQQVWKPALRHSPGSRSRCAVERSPALHEPKGRASSPLRADGCNHAFLQRKERRARSDAPYLANRLMVRCGSIQAYLDRFRRERSPSYAIKPKLEFGCARRCGTRVRSPQNPWIGLNT